MKWIKAETVLLERLALHRWTKEHPAPWEVGSLYAQARLACGERLSIRDLAGYMGWSRRKSSECLKDARARVDELYSERDTRWDTRWDTRAQGYQVDAPINGTDLVAFRDGSGTPHARAYLETRSRSDPEGLEQDPPLRGEADQQATGSGLADPGGGSPRPGKDVPSEPKGTPSTKAKTIGTADTRVLWDALLAMRHQHRPGARRQRTLDPALARAIRTGLDWTTHDAILHAYDWWLRSAAARWFRDRGVDVDTFLRPSKLGGFVRQSEEWSFKEEQAKRIAEDALPLADDLMPF